MSTVNLNENDFEQVVTKEGITLIDWWAPWCGPCRTFGPIYEKVSEKYPDITFGKVNTEDNRGLQSAFQIRSIPTLMVFRDGVMLFNQSGMLPEKALDSIIEQVSALDMKAVHEEIERAKKKESALSN